jgi:pimeloyl-ACP methyl ester carboxylesterase
VTTSRTVETTDGLSLALYEAGDRDLPTLVAVHGYPDDHTVWDGVVDRLAGRFHVVTYDVRGAGASEAPASRAGYRIPQLVADLGAVIDAVAPGEQVYLLAHDWGSIQSWDALTDPAIAPLLLSYTSISGPSLDMAARWLRRPERPVARLRQLADSSYIVGFQLPWLPELVIQRGILGRLVDHSKRTGAHAAPTDRQLVQRDAVNGLELYRANFTGRMARPSTSPITVPVQVLAPEDDAHVTPALQLQAPAPYVARLTTVRIPGNHWVVEQDPDLVVRHLLAFIDQL